MAAHRTTLPRKQRPSGNPPKDRKGAPAAGPVPVARPRRPSAKTTIYDLARLAAVSPGTVSRVLNNRDRVKAETRERVLRVARELNIQPQAAVRFRKVAILSEPTFPDRVEGYAATLTSHLSFALSRRKVGVILPGDPIEELPGMFFDGAIAVTADEALRSLLEDLETRMPVVYMDRFPLVSSEYCICSDHWSTGYLAAQHFIEHGRTRLAFLGANYPSLVERIAGFKTALKEHKVPVDERRMNLFGPEINHVSAVTRLIRAGADAIYAPGSSFEAMECLHILTYVMGMKVPQQIALIGGENDGVSSLLNPPLTTIEEPLREMAEQAATMIDALTSGQRLKNRRVKLPVRLIERASVN